MLETSGSKDSRALAALLVSAASRCRPCRRHRGLLQGQAYQPDRQLRHRRRLRRLRAGSGAPYGKAYSRQSQHHHPEHAGRRPLRGTNYIYNVAPKDGTVFGTFARNMALFGLLKTSQNVQFDPTKFTWLGSSSTLANDAYTLLIVRKDAKVKSVRGRAQPGGPPIMLGSRTAEGVSSDAMGVVLREWLGFNIKAHPGLYRQRRAVPGDRARQGSTVAVGLSAGALKQAGLAQARRPRDAYWSCSELGPSSRIFPTADGARAGAHRRIATD